MSQKSDAAAHFVPLRIIMSEYGGSLLHYMQSSTTKNVVVTMDVGIDIAQKKRTSFFVAVAVTMDFEATEPLVDEVERQTPNGYESLFAWVPAHLFGTDDFGIMIDEIGFGENLQNGLVSEVIQKAQIEEAVEALVVDQGAA